jgi:hypothetical protein
VLGRKARLYRILIAALPTLPLGLVHASAQRTPGAARLAHKWFRGFDVGVLIPGLIALRQHAARQVMQTQGRLFQGAVLQIAALHRAEKVRKVVFHFFCSKRIAKSALCKK